MRLQKCRIFTNVYWNVCFPYNPMLSSARKRNCFEVFLPNTNHVQMWLLLSNNPRHSYDLDINRHVTHVNSLPNIMTVSWQFVDCQIVSHCLQWNFPWTGPDAIFPPCEPSSPRQLAQGNSIPLTELKQQYPSHKKGSTSLQIFDHLETQRQNNKWG